MSPPRRQSPSAAEPEIPQVPLSTQGLRILDANGNRASEGLRVVEDFLRFAQDDGHLAHECKQLRHALADALAGLPYASLTLARNAAADVGRPMKTPQELTRLHPSDILQANLKRVQQALRSLEEWSKLQSEALAQQFEAIRYRLYELETAISRVTHSSQDLQDVQLYVLIDGGLDERDFRHRVESLLDVGVPLLQLRDKRLDDRALLNRATQLMHLASRTPTRIIINDRLDVALAVGAHGVHLGQDDLPIPEARRLLGPTALIGASTHCIEQARSAVFEGASYVGVGPTFPSSTKQFTQFPGLDLVREVAREVQLPAFAIGGIDLPRLDDILACGLNRVAVSSAVWNVDHAGDAARRFLARLAQEQRSSSTSDSREVRS